MTEQSSSTPRTLVVGAAVLRGGRLLATRRTAPPELAGRWELPGGKVEPGETPSAALEREVSEELGCEVEVTGWLAGSTAIGETHELRVATVRLRSGEPEPVEHDRVRWLAPDELGEVDWLEPDRPFLREIEHVLRATPPPAYRAIVFEEDDARSLQARLRSDGYDAELVRERLAGEDDDDDQPWAVLSDAPAALVEVLLDEVGGWLDHWLDDDVAGEQTGAGGGWPAAGARTGPPAPPPLPTRPRRVKRPLDP